MDKKQINKTTTDYNTLSAENEKEQARAGEQQQEDRRSQDLDDKRPAGDAGPEDAPDMPRDETDIPY